MITDFLANNQPTDDGLVGFWALYRPERMEQIIYNAAAALRAAYPDWRPDREPRQDPAVRSAGEVQAA